MGGANAIIPMLDELACRGHRTRLLLEGDGAAATRTTTSFIQVTSLEDVQLQFLELHPHVVITGLASPRILENELDRIARDAGVLVVHVEDFWAAHRRAEFVPDLCITVDELAARLIGEDQSGARSVVAGFAGIRNVTPSSEIVDRMHEVRQLHPGTALIVYPDCGPTMELALPRLVASINRTKRPCVLLPKFHPKLVALPRPDGKGTWGEWGTEILTRLRSPHAAVLLEGSVDEIIECADAVASGYSSTLFRKAIKSELALTLWDKAVQANLRAESGLDLPPLMFAGRYPVLDKVRPLDRYFEHCCPAYPLYPFSAPVAADAVESLF